MPYIGSRFINSFTILILFQFVAAKFYCQQIPKDTSYTPKSALAKVQKKYPTAELVKPIESLEITIYNNLVYANRNGRKLHLDLFLPNDFNNKKLPLIILIHGGGWSSGNKTLMVPLSQHLALSNFISAAVEYRLSPEARYPAAVQDIKTAIKWLKYNSAKYNIDTNKIVLLGGSAGGHLAALAGITSGIKKYEIDGSFENVSSKVQAVIDIDGVLDFTHPAESGKDTNAAKPSVGARWLGYTYKENPEIWEEVSPVNYVAKNTPPILFINSSVPRFHAGRDEMIKKMNKFDIYSEVHTLNDSPHSFWLFKPWFEPTKNYILIFLNRVL